MDSNLLSLVTGGAGALVVLALIAWAFYAGKLHSNPEFEREVQRRELLEATIAEKNAALKAASDRADAAVRASELIADAFTDARRRRGGDRAGTHGT